MDGIAEATAAWEVRATPSSRRAGFQPDTQRLDGSTASGKDARPTTAGGDERCPECADSACSLPRPPKSRKHDWVNGRPHDTYPNVRVMPRTKLTEEQLSEESDDLSWYREPVPVPLNGLDLKAMVRATTWMWPGWIADGRITVLAGESGVGKSWLALAVAKAAAHGLPWPDGQPSFEDQAPILWLESEGRQALLLERAEKLGFDPELMLFMPRPLQTYYLDRPEDFDHVFRLAEAVKPRLIVVDSWSKSLAGKENDADVRFCLDNLQGMARVVGAPLLLVHHLRKRQLTDYSDSFDFDRLRGSSVLAQVAATIIGVDQPDRSTAGRRVSCGKANLGPLPEPFGFEITDAGLSFGPPPQPDEPTSRLDEAKAFLHRALANGPRPASEVKAEAKEEGIAEETLLIAKRATCNYKRADGARAHWLWWLKDASEEAEEAEAALPLAQ